MTDSKILLKSPYYVVSGSFPLFFLIIFFLILPGKTKAAFDDSSSITVLETANSFLGHWCSANDNYLYGIDYRNPRRIVRKIETGQLVETRGMIDLADTGAREIARIYGASTPGLIFVVTSSASNNFNLLRSEDGGSTFEKVFVFGEGNNIGGTNTPNVRMLRGILELTHDLPGGGGKGTLFIGEYNFSRPRVPGGTNDRVRIMKSLDNGRTWIKVMEWNTNGTNQVGHVHAMKQDPYTGEIYICVGDVNGKAGIIKWDGVSAWRDNVTLKDLSQISGFSVLTGSQRYRACDVLFDQNYFYTFVDTQLPNNLSGSESGIWRGTKDFSSFKRMNNHVFDYDPMHIGWFGAKIGNRFVFTTAREKEGSTTWKEANTQVYTSDDGINWNVTGVLNWRYTGPDSSTRYISHVFTFNNKLYIDCVGGAGHYSTIQCEFSRKWSQGDDPVILHPVFYLGKWNTQGNDASNGTNPDYPKATLKSLLENNTISAGSRIRVSDGIFSESDIYALWSGTFIQGIGSVVIEGKGYDSTLIIRNKGGGNPWALRIEKDRTLSGIKAPLIIKNLSFVNQSDEGSGKNSYIIYNHDSFVITRGCYLGGTENDDSPLIFLSQPGAGYQSDSSFHVAGKRGGRSVTIIESGEDQQVIEMKNCVILDFNDAITLNHPGYALILKNCTFYGINRYCINFDAGTTTSPQIYNCIFVSGTSPINNHAGISQSGINYNFYNQPNINLTGGSKSIYEIDPLFTAPDKNDFSLQSNSPCALSGTPMPDVLFDITGKKRWNPPSMGAYENPAIKVFQQTIEIDSASGSTTMLYIISNCSWSIDCDCGWLSLSHLSGIGSDTIVISALTNNSSKESRTSTLTLTGTGLVPQIVKVIQQGSVVTENPEYVVRKLKIYPNPVSASLVIDYGDDKFGCFFIIDSNGIVLKKEESVSPLQQIDVSRFRSGTYFIRFVDPGSAVVKFEVVR